MLPDAGVFAVGDQLAVAGHDPVARPGRPPPPVTEAALAGSRRSAESSLLSVAAGLSRGVATGSAMIAVGEHVDGPARRRQPKVSA